MACVTIDECVDIACVHRSRERQFEYGARSGSPNKNLIIKVCDSMCIYTVNYYVTNHYYAFVCPVNNNWSPILHE